LGLSDTTTLGWSKVSAGTAPLVSVVGDATQTFLVSDGIKVSSQLVASSVCSGKQVRGG
jgi:hypothetical protein